MRSTDVFEILVREHAGSLSVFLRSAVADPGLADDLFQETVLAAWQGLERYDRTRPFGAWLRGIAARKVAESRRRRGRAVLVDAATLEALEERCRALDAAPGDSLDERLELLRRCIASLSSDDRESLAARYEDELRGAPLAARLGASLESARKRVQRARARLGACLEGRLRISEGLGR